MIARSALEREETRGTHARTDYPERNAELDGRHAVIEGGEQMPNWRVWE